MIPLCCLAGNMHKPAYYNWCAVCMVRALGIFHNMVLKIIESPGLVLCEMDIMSIFGEILDELLTFKEWWDYM